MLKISETGPPNHSVTLKLEGRIVGPWVEEFRRVCESFLSENRVLKLDLAEVSYADAEGVATLNNFRSRGVTLKHCSPFVEQQIMAAS
jgi:ABC-type transporter Mla MlaB component